jgi:hypothetical protein
MGIKKSKSVIFLRKIFVAILQYVSDRSLLREMKFLIFTAHFVLSGRKNESSYN